MSPAPLVSVFVFAAGPTAAIEPCRSAIEAQTYRPREITVAAPHAAPCPLGTARSELVALLASDTVPHPEWLRAAVDLLRGDPTVGAVAPLVFHAEYPLLLQSAGGTLTWRADPLDWCAGTPYEFATLPRDVLFPSGGAVLLRQSTVASLAPLDQALGSRLAHVELGVRVWAHGQRVALCPDAWVERSADGATGQPTGAAERDRIRLALTTFPAAHLRRWLVHEVRSRSIRHPAAWAWNLRRLGSCRRQRRRLSAAGAAIGTLLAPTWQVPTRGQRHVLPPDPAGAGAALRLDGVTDASSLGYGWYAAEQDGTRSFRPTMPAASAVVALPTPSARLRIVWRGAREIETATLSLRPWGRRTIAWRAEPSPPPTAWEQRRFPCALAPGVYEVLVRSAPAQYRAGRARGVDVAAIELDPAPPS